MNGTAVGWRRDFVNVLSLKFYFIYFIIYVFILNFIYYFFSNLIKLNIKL